MQATETNVNASGAPERPASQSEIPKWATHTADESTYTLMMCDNDGSVYGQDIDIDRAEFIALKKHLAKMRGYEVPEADDESAAVEVPEPTNGAAAEAAGAEEAPISERVITGLIDHIVDNLGCQQRFIVKRRNHWSASDLSEFQADMALLKEIVSDWIGDGFQQDFPKETKLIGTIRGHLNL